MPKNVGLVFAGGVGKRMNSEALPKQFLKVNGKPIIVYTLEQFQNTPEINDIVVVIVSGWEDYMDELVSQYQLTKVRSVITGGSNTQESQYKGLKKISEFGEDDSIVLIHDGVRPLIDVDLIQRNILNTAEHGNAITVTKAIETITKVDSNEAISEILDRNDFRMARAPQTYRLMDILSTHEKAIKDGNLDFIDSASMMNFYGERLSSVVGSTDNIKVTTPIDYFVFKGILEARNQRDIFGQDYE
jgi:2-C-methyl-D-erythritol 4-phosphate cytidylyltransferase